MAALPKIAEIPDLEVDPITLDIIENALRHARFEMDAVLFRSRDVARSSASSTTSSRCSPTRRAGWSSASSAPTSTR